MKFGGGRASESDLFSVFVAILFKNMYNKTKEVKTATGQRE